MTYKVSAKTYNKRMDKIFEIYRQQQKEKNVLSKSIYKKDYEKLSDKQKNKINHIWGDMKGIP